MVTEISIRILYENMNKTRKINVANLGLAQKNGNMTAIFSNE